MKKLEQKNWLEWTVFAIGSALLVAIVLYLSYDMLAAPTGPPHLRVELSPAQRRSSSLVIPVKVVNDGPSAAERVRVEVTLESSDGTETGGFEIVLLPRASSRFGEVVFSQITGREFELKARVLGYETDH